MKKAVIKVMEEVFNQPTAPFRENWVLSYVRAELHRMGVPYFTDTWGNIIAGVSNPKILRTSRRIGLVAHTDHPGFHLIEKKNKSTWLAQWHGGCPPVIYKAPVAIHNPAQPTHKVRGQIISKKFLKPSQKEFLIKLRTKNDNLDKNCFGAFDYQGFDRKGHRLFTRAADDLTGVTIILCTLARLNQGQRKHALGIFTRAEEVGFRGTLGIIYEKLLGPHNTVISLEASSQKPGAKVGHGPVIRLGDRRTLFDSIVTSGLDQAVSCIKKRSKKFKIQRRIMDGGTCEATAFNLYGIRASGIAVPLGNYHNQRPNGRPGPEFIDVRDVESAVSLCVEFYKNVAKKMNPTQDFLKMLKKEFNKGKPLLTQKVLFTERRG